MRTKIKIAKGVPMPRGSRSLGLPWNEIRVNESFKFPDGVPETSARTLAAAAGRRYGKKFSVSKIGGLRAWRVA